MRLIFCCLCFVASLYARPLDREVDARSAILMNADTGAILFEKHAHLPYFPASTTKVAVALYLLDRGGDLGEETKVSREAMKYKPSQGQMSPWWLAIDGTMMGIKVGEILTLDSLLHGLILASGNDAANVIAEHLAGSVPEFMNQLNAYLAEIGCKNTYFRNPHGLNDAEHRSSAYDLALITQKALRFPKFREVAKTRFFDKIKSNKQPATTIRSHNPLIDPQSRHYYPKAIGIKTGFTTASKFTMIAAAEQEGRTLIAVLLGCETSQSRSEDAKNLFEAAFAEKPMSRRLVGPEHIFTQEVKGSRHLVKASVALPLSISFFPAEEPQCKAALHWNLSALPIHKGQKVGEIRIVDERERLLERADLLALEEVQGSFLYRLQKLFFE